MLLVRLARVELKRGSPRSQLSILSLSASIFLSALLLLCAAAQPACRDPDVARGLGSVAHAADLDATIQYFGHNFFQITTSQGTMIVMDPLAPGRYRPPTSPPM